jgi:hypothetical protein
MSIDVIYSSLETPADSAVAECAVRSAIADRAGAWTVCLVRPPHQALWVVVVDGPNGYIGTWAFDEEDQHFAAIRSALIRDLPRESE